MSCDVGRKVGPIDGEDTHGGALKDLIITIQGLFVC